MAIGMMLINVTTNNMLAAKGHTLTVVCVIAYTVPAWVQWQKDKLRGRYGYYGQGYGAATSGVS
jgi:hypothetical protein